MWIDSNKIGLIVLKLSFLGSDATLKVPTGLLRV